MTQFPLNIWLLAAFPGQTSKTDHHKDYQLIQYFNRAKLWNWSLRNVKCSAVKVIMTDPGRIFGRSDCASTSAGPSASHSRSPGSRCESAGGPYILSFSSCSLWQTPCSKGHKLLVMLTDNNPDPKQGSCFCWWRHMDNSEPETLTSSCKHI